MKIYLYQTVLAFSILLTFSVQQFAQEQSVKNLDLLIGTWDVEEAMVSGSNLTVAEKGLRTCSYILSDTYILCETRSRGQNGKERIYQFFINYNKLDKKFEMISIYSDWDRKRFDTITIDEKAGRWNLMGAPTTENGVERRIWGVIQFEGTDKFIWTVRRNKATDTPMEWTEIFRETAVRRNKY